MKNDKVRADLQAAIEVVHKRFEDQNGDRTRSIDDILEEVCVERPEIADELRAYWLKRRKLVALLKAGNKAPRRKVR